ncbi:MAG: autotransporter domain-containing protein [Candidatus Endonucleobacter sp. (ex Gigantidas childressi)]|nr:autotransporter domain-containing protein [Candidatus Endonucleobacter sp. (ex Gigantidas childressi)]
MRKLITSIARAYVSSCLLFFIALCLPLYVLPEMVTEDNKVEIDGVEINITQDIFRGHDRDKAENMEEKEVCGNYIRNSPSYSSTRLYLRINCKNNKEFLKSAKESGYEILLTEAQMLKLTIADEDLIRTSDRKGLINHVGRSMHEKFEVLSSDQMSSLLNGISMRRLFYIVNLDWDVDKKELDARLARIKHEYDNPNGRSMKELEDDTARIISGINRYINNQPVKLGRNSDSGYYYKMSHDAHKVDNVDNKYSKLRFMFLDIIRAYISKKYSIVIDCFVNPSQCESKDHGTSMKGWLEWLYYLWMEVSVSVENLFNPDHRVESNYEVGVVNENSDQKNDRGNELYNVDSKRMTNIANTSGVGLNDNSQRYDNFESKMIDIMTGLDNLDSGKNDNNKKVSENSEALSKLQSAKSNVGSKNKMLRSPVKLSSVYITKVEAEQGKIKRKISDLEGKLEKYKLEKGKLSDVTEKTVTEDDVTNAEKLLSDIKTAKDTQDALSNELSSHGESIAFLNNSVTRNDGLVASKADKEKADKEKAETLKREAQTNLKTLTETLSNINISINELKSTIESAANKVIENDRKLSQVNSDKASVDNDNMELKSKLELASLDISEAQISIKGIKKYVGGMSSKLEEFETAKGKLGGITAGTIKEQHLVDAQQLLSNIKNENNKKNDLNEEQEKYDTNMGYLNSAVNNQNTLVQGQSVDEEAESNLKNLLDEYRQEIARLGDKNVESMLFSYQSRINELKAINVADKFEAKSSEKIEDTSKYSEVLQNARASLLALQTIFRNREGTLREVHQCDNVFSCVLSGAQNKVLSKEDAEALYENINKDKKAFNDFIVKSQKDIGSIGISINGITSMINGFESFESGIVNDIKNSKINNIDLNAHEEKQKDVLKKLNTLIVPENLDGLNDEKISLVKKIQGIIKSTSELKKAKTDEIEASKSGAKTRVKKFFNKLKKDKTSLKKYGQSFVRLSDNAKTELGLVENMLNTSFKDVLFMRISEIKKSIAIAIPKLEQAVKGVLDRVSTSNDQLLETQNNKKTLNSDDENSKSQIASSTEGVDSEQKFINKEVKSIENNFDKYKTGSDSLGKIKYANIVESDVSDAGNLLYNIGVLEGDIIKVETKLSNNERSIRTLYDNVETLVSAQNTADYKKEAETNLGDLGRELVNIKSNMDTLKSIIEGARNKVIENNKELSKVRSSKGNVDNDNINLKSKLNLPSLNETNVENSMNSINNYITNMSYKVEEFEAAQDKLNNITEVTIKKKDVVDVKQLLLNIQDENNKKNVLDVEKNKYDKNIESLNVAVQKQNTLVQGRYNNENLDASKDKIESFKKEKVDSMLSSYSDMIDKLDGVDTLSKFTKDVGVDGVDPSQYSDGLVNLKKEMLESKTKFSSSSVKIQSDMHKCDSTFSFCWSAQNKVLSKEEAEKLHGDIGLYKEYIEQSIGLLERSINSIDGNIKAIDYMLDDFNNFRSEEESKFKYKDINTKSFDTYKERQKEVLEQLNKLVVSEDLSDMYDKKGSLIQEILQMMEDADNLKKNKEDHLGNLLLGLKSTFDEFSHKLNDFKSDWDNKKTSYNTLKDGADEENTLAASMLTISPKDVMFARIGEIKVSIAISLPKIKEIVKGIIEKVSANNDKLLQAKNNKNTLHAENENSESQSTTSTVDVDRAKDLIDEEIESIKNKLDKYNMASDSLSKVKSAKVEESHVTNAGILLTNIKALDNQITTFEGKLTLHEASVTAHHELVGKLVNAQDTEVKKNARTNLNNLNNLNAELVEINSDMDTLKSTIESAKNKVKENDRKLSQVNSDKASVDNDNMKLKSKLELASLDISEAQISINGIKKYVGGMSSKLEEFETAKGKLGGITAGTIKEQHLIDAQQLLSNIKNENNKKNDLNEEQEKYDTNMGYLNVAVNDQNTLVQGRYNNENLDASKDKIESFKEENVYSMLSSYSEMIDELDGVDTLSKFTNDVNVDGVDPSKYSEVLVNLEKEMLESKTKFSSSSVKIQSDMHKCDSTFSLCWYAKNKVLSKEDTETLHGNIEAYQTYIGESIESLESSINSIDGSINDIDYMLDGFNEFKSEVKSKFKDKDINTKSFDTYKERQKEVLEQLNKLVVSEDLSDMYDKKVNLIQEIQQMMEDADNLKKNKEDYLGNLLLDLDSTFDKFSNKLNDFKNGLNNKKISYNTLRNGANGEKTLAASMLTISSRDVMFARDGGTKVSIGTGLPKTKKVKGGIKSEDTPVNSGDSNDKQDTTDEFEGSKKVIVSNKKKAVNGQYTNNNPLNIPSLSGRSSSVKPGQNTGGPIHSPASDLVTEDEGTKGSIALDKGDTINSEDGVKGEVKGEGEDTPVKSGDSNDKQDTTDEFEGSKKVIVSNKKKAVNGQYTNNNPLNIPSLSGRSSSVKPGQNTGGPIHSPASDLVTEDEGTKGSIALDKGDTINSEDGVKGEVKGEGEDTPVKSGDSNDKQDTTDEFEGSKKVIVSNKKKAVNGQYTNNNPLNIPSLSGRSSSVKPGQNTGGPIHSPASDLVTEDEGTKGSIALDKGDTINSEDGVKGEVKGEGEDTPVKSGDSNDKQDTTDEFEGSKKVIVSNKKKAVNGQYTNNNPLNIPSLSGRSSSVKPGQNTGGPIHSPASDLVTEDEGTKGSIALDKGDTINSEDGVKGEVKGEGEDTPVKSGDSNDKQDTTDEFEGSKKVIVSNKKKAVNGQYTNNNPLNIPSLSGRSSSVKPGQNTGGPIHSPASDLVTEDEGTKGSIALDKGDTINSEDGVKGEVKGEGEDTPVKSGDSNDKQDTTDEFEGSKKVIVSNKKKAVNGQYTNNNPLNIPSLSGRSSSVKPGQNTGGPIHSPASDLVTEDEGTKGSIALDKGDTINSEDGVKGEVKGEGEDTPVKSGDSNDKQDTTDEFEGSKKVIVSNKKKAVNGQYTNNNPLNIPSLSGRSSSVKPGQNTGGPIHSPASDLVTEDEGTKGSIALDKGDTINSEDGVKGEVKGEGEDTPVKSGDSNDKQDTTDEFEGSKKVIVSNKKKAVNGQYTNNNPLNIPSLSGRSSSVKPGQNTGGPIHSPASDLVTEDEGTKGSIALDKGDTINSEDGVKGEVKGEGEDTPVKSGDSNDKQDTTDEFEGSKKVIVSNKKKAVNGQYTNNNPLNIPSLSGRSSSVKPGQNTGGPIHSPASDLVTEDEGTKGSIALDKGDTINSEDGVKGEVKGEGEDTPVKSGDSNDKQDTTDEFEGSKKVIVSNKKKAVNGQYTNNNPLNIPSLSGRSSSVKPGQNTGGPIHSPASDLVTEDEGTKGSIALDKGDTINSEDGVKGEVKGEGEDTPVKSGDSNDKQDTTDEFEGSKKVIVSNKKKAVNGQYTNNNPLNIPSLSGRSSSVKPGQNTGGPIHSPASDLVTEDEGTKGSIALDKGDTINSEDGVKGEVKGEGEDTPVKSGDSNDKQDTTDEFEGSKKVIVSNKKKAVNGQYTNNNPLNIPSLSGRSSSVKPGQNTGGPIHSPASDLVTEDEGTKGSIALDKGDTINSEDEDEDGVTIESEDEDEDEDGVKGEVKGEGEDTPVKSGDSNDKQDTTDEFEGSKKVIVSNKKKAVNGQYTNNNPLNIPSLSGRSSSFKPSQNTISSDTSMAGVEIKLKSIGDLNRNSSSINKIFTTEGHSSSNAVNVNDIVGDTDKNTQKLDGANLEESISKWTQFKKEANNPMLDEKEKKKLRKTISKYYRNLSLKFHPDKGGKKSDYLRSQIRRKYLTDVLSGIVADDPDAKTQTAEEMTLNGWNAYRGRPEEQAITENYIDSLSMVMFFAMTNFRWEMAKGINSVVAAVSSERSHLGALSAGTVSLDNLSAEELQASIINRNQLTDNEPGSWHTFVQVNGAKGSVKGHDHRPSQAFKSYGLTIGAFKEIDRNLIAGALFGTQKHDASIGDSGRLIGESVLFGPFMSWTKNNWHVDTSLTWAMTSYSSSRHDLFNNNLKAHYNSSELTGYFNLGYDIHMSGALQGLILGPMIEFLYQRSEFGSFQETDNNMFSLKVGKRSRSHTSTRVGLDIGYLLKDLENPTEVGVTFGFQNQSSYRQNGEYGYLQTTSGTSSSIAYNAPASSVDSVFYGLRYRRLFNNNAVIKIELSGVRGRNERAESLQLVIEKKI